MEQSKDNFKYIFRISTVGCSAWFYRDVLACITLSVPNKRHVAMHVREKWVFSCVSGDIPGNDEQHQAHTQVCRYHVYPHVQGKRPEKGEQFWWSFHRLLVDDGDTEV